MGYLGRPEKFDKVQQERFPT